MATTHDRRDLRPHHTTNQPATQTPPGNFNPDEFYALTDPSQTSLLIQALNYALSQNITPQTPFPILPNLTLTYRLINKSSRFTLTPYSSRDFSSLKRWFETPVDLTSPQLSLDKLHLFSWYSSLLETPRLYQTPGEQVLYLNFLVNLSTTINEFVDNPKIPEIVDDESFFRFCACYQNNSSLLSHDQPGVVGLQSTLNHQSNSGNLSPAQCRALNKYLHTIPLVCSWHCDLGAFCFNPMNQLIELYHTRPYRYQQTLHSLVHQSLQHRNFSALDVLFRSVQMAHGYVDASVLITILRMDEYELFNQLTNHTKKLFPQLRSVFQPKDGEFIESETPPRITSNVDTLKYAQISFIHPTFYEDTPYLPMLASALPNPAKDNIPESFMGTVVHKILDYKNQLRQILDKYTQLENFLIEHRQSPQPASQLQQQLQQIEDQMRQLQSRAQRTQHYLGQLDAIQTNFLFFIKIAVNTDRHLSMTSSLPHGIIDHRQSITIPNYIQPPHKSYDLPNAENIVTPPSISDYFQQYFPHLVPFFTISHSNSVVYLTNRSIAHLYHTLGIRKVPVPPRYNEFFSCLNAAPILSKLFWLSELLQADYHELVPFIDMYILEPAEFFTKLQFREVYCMLLHQPLSSIGKMIYIWTHYSPTFLHGLLVNEMALAVPNSSVHMQSPSQKSLRFYQSRSQATYYEMIITLLYNFLIYVAPYLVQPGSNSNIWAIATDLRSIICDKIYPTGISSSTYIIPPVPIYQSCLNCIVDTVKTLFYPLALPEGILNPNYKTPLDSNYIPLNSSQSGSNGNSILACPNSGSSLCNSNSNNCNQLISTSKPPGLPYSVQYALLQGFMPQGPVSQSQLVSHQLMKCPPTSIVSTNYHNVLLMFVLNCYIRAEVTQRNTYTTNNHDGMTNNSTSFNFVDDVVSTIAQVEYYPFLKQPVWQPYKKNVYALFNSLMPQGTE